MIDVLDPTALAAIALFAGPQNRPERPTSRRLPSRGPSWSIILATITTLILIGFGAVLCVIPPEIKIDYKWVGGFMLACALINYIIILRRE